MRVTRAGRLDLAAYLDQVGRGALAAVAWRDMSAVRYLDSELEEIRVAYVAYVARIGPRARELSAEGAECLRLVALGLAV